MPGEVDNQGNAPVDKSQIVLLNSHQHTVELKQPDTKTSWRVDLNTGNLDLKTGERIVRSNETIDVPGRSVLLLT